MHYFINLVRNKLKFVCLELRLTHVFDFKWRRGQPCPWLSGTNNWVRAHVGDIIIVWRNTHNNTEPNAIWFLATLTDTDLNIQGIKVKYRTNGNCNIPATESRLWGTKWYYLFSAQVRMLRCGAFGILYTTIFNWTFKNCVSRRGFSKGYWWPGSLRRQDIISHDIDYVEYVGPGLPWGRILSTCVISMWSNDMKCKYIFMFPLQNLARKELNLSLCFLLFMSVLAMGQDQSSAGVDRPGGVFGHYHRVRGTVG